MRAPAAFVVFAMVAAGCLGGSAPPGPGVSTDPPEAFPPRLETTVHETGYLGYEPTVGVSPAGNVFVAGAGLPADLMGYEAVRATMVLRSPDGAAWTPVNDFPFTSDPILHADGSGRVYRAHQVSGQCASLAWSDDEGATWMERPAACGDLGVDFLKLASGPPGPDPNPLSAAAEHVVYLCHNRNGGGDSTTVCAASFDGGLTWPQDEVAAVRDRDGCGGVTSFPAVGPDGTVVVPLGGGCEAVHLATSTDSGATWNVSRLPYPGAGSVTPRAAFDDAGRLYVLSADWARRLHLSIQEEPGGAWRDVDVTPEGVTSLGFVAMDVTSDGTVLYAFTATGDAETSPSEAPPGTVWTLWLGAWRSGAVAAQPVEEMHVGRVCYGGSGCPRNLGDFLDGTVGPDGRFWVSFVDGCDGCGQEQATGTALKVVEARVR